MPKTERSRMTDEKVERSKLNKEVTAQTNASLCQVADDGTYQAFLNTARAVRDY